MGQWRFGLGWSHREFVPVRVMAKFIRTDKTDFIDVIEGPGECFYCISQ